MPKIYKPEFIPFYMEEVSYLSLSHLGGLVYGFIRFYKKDGKDFYFNSKQLAEILSSTEGTINNIISDLTKKGAILTHRKIKNGGGTMRYINKVYTKKEIIDKGGLKSLQNEIHIKNNILKENKRIGTNLEKFVIAILGLENKLEVLNMFDNKKTIERISDLCKIISQISSRLDIKPVFNKDTINATDIMIYNYKFDVDDIVEYCIDNDWNEYCDDYYDLIRNDYYLPAEMASQLLGKDFYTYK